MCHAVHVSRRVRFFAVREDVARKPLWGPSSSMGICVKDVRCVGFFRGGAAGGERVARAGLGPPVGAGPRSESEPSGTLVY